MQVFYVFRLGSIGYSLLALKNFEVVAYRWQSLIKLENEGVASKEPALFIGRSSMR